MFFKETQTKKWTALLIHKMSTVIDSQPLGIFFLLELFYQGGKLIAIQQGVKPLV